MRMNFRQMEYFVCVAEAGSFTRASAILRVAQPALSRQIRQLEEQLEVSLLVRNGRGVVTTEVGEKYLNQCKGILRQIDRANEEIALFRGSTSGHAAIGMPMTVCNYLGVPLANRFREQLPDIKLSILQGRSSVLEDWLGSGRIDLAVLYNADYLSNVERTTLVNDHFVLVQPPGSDVVDPIPACDLQQLPLIMPGQRNMVRTKIEEHLGKVGAKLNVALEIDNVANILELVRSGLGYAVLSSRTVRNFEQGKDLPLRKIVDPELSMTLSLVVPCRPATPSQNATIRVIEDVCRSAFF